MTDDSSNLSRWRGSEIASRVLVRTWLIHTDLEFGINDFVAVFYPKSYKAEIYLASVRDIQPEEVALDHWPTNDSGPLRGHPYYQKPSGDTTWRESRRFWRLIHRVDPPKEEGGHPGVYTLSGKAFELVHRLGKEFALT